MDKLKFLFCFQLARGLKIMAILALIVFSVLLVYAILGIAHIPGRYIFIAPDLWLVLHHLRQKPLNPRLDLRKEVEVKLATTLPLGSSRVIVASRSAYIHCCWMGWRTDHRFDNYRKMDAKLQKMHLTRLKEHFSKVHFDFAWDI